MRINFQKEIHDNKTYWESIFGKELCEKLFRSVAYLMPI